MRGILPFVFLIFSNSILLSGCYSGIGTIEGTNVRGTITDAPVQEGNTINNKKLQGLIGRSKNKVFKKIGNPISCEIVDGSEFCIYSETTPGAIDILIVYPMYSSGRYDIGEVWLNCYCLEFGKDGNLKNYEHEVVDSVEYDYPFEHENCYDQFDVPLSIPE